MMVANVSGNRVQRAPPAGTRPAAPKCRLGVRNLSLTVNERFPTPNLHFGTRPEELVLWFALVRDPFATKTFKKVQSSSCTFSRNPFEALATIICSFDLGLRVPDLFKVPYLKDGVRDYRFSGRWVGNYADRDLLLVKLWFLGSNRVG